MGDVKKQIEKILYETKYGLISLDEAAKKLTAYIPSLRKGTMIPGSTWGWCCCCGAVQVNAADGYDTCQSCLENV